MNLDLVLGFPGVHPNGEGGAGGGAGPAGGVHLEVGGEGHRSLHRAPVSAEK